MLHQFLLPEDESRISPLTTLYRGCFRFIIASSFLWFLILTQPIFQAESVCSLLSTMILSTKRFHRTAPHQSCQGSPGHHPFHPDLVLVWTMVLSPSTARRLSFFRFAARSCSVNSLLWNIKMSESMRPCCFSLANI